MNATRTGQCRLVLLAGLTATLWAWAARAATPAANPSAAQPATAPAPTSATAPAGLTYPIVGTGQRRIFNDRTQLLKAPKPGEAFFGQDGFYQGLPFNYRDNQDGTISDLTTGLMWVKARGQKVTWAQAVADADKCRAGGYSDWRLPTIKELYSLINFNGAGRSSPNDSIPYLDTRYFEFKYGDPAQGDRLIDCQDWSATTYVGTTMGGDPTAFGVNFADGRIKGYPKSNPRGEMKLYGRYVRGNPQYGKNHFHDNDDGSISDEATGLMWSKIDSGKGMTWQEALAWAGAANKQHLMGHGDWRLPNAKELQSLVDYTRAPDATDPARRGPAIDPVFQVTRISDGDYPFFWSSTTHLDGPAERQGEAAVYVAFGRATGWMQAPPGQGEYRLMDVHGAGAQRSDPKVGNAADYPHGRGPQGDVIRINNQVRLVRNIKPDAVRLVEPDLSPLPMPPRPLPPGRGR